MQTDRITLKPLMVKKSLVILGLIFSLVTRAQEGRVVHEKYTQERQVPGFHGIRVSNGINLVITKGNVEKLVLGADEADRLDKIKTDVKDGVLRIYVENAAAPWNWHKSDRANIVAYVSYTHLDELGASGGSGIIAEGELKGEALRLHLSGGGGFNGRVAVRELSVDMSGGSSVKIAGSSGNASIDASGGGNFDGDGLAAEDCTIEASGGSDISITVNKTLSVRSSGGSDVHYKGTGTVKRSSISGGGSVAKMN